MATGGAPRAVAAVRGSRAATLLATDTVVWVAAVAGFVWLRFALEAGSLAGTVDRTPWRAALLVGLLAAGAHGGVGRLVRLHQGRSAIGSLDEMLALGLVVAAAGAIVTGLNLGAGRPVPGSVPVAASCAALVLMAWLRAGYRTVLDQHLHRLLRAHVGSRPASRTIVYGVGEAGRQLVVSMLRQPAGRWRPVALLDDDPAKRHRRVRGIPVLGGGDVLVQVAARTGASVVVVAIPSASGALLQDVSRRARAAGLEVKVLPGPDGLVTPGQARVGDVRDVAVTDLLGRRQVDTDIAAVAGYLTGRRVLVTGAGGSIGSELCRQIARFGPAELIMLDRDESALHGVQLSLHGRALLDTDDVVLADIRDAARVEAVFAERRPEVVFHAAALKHLPMLEQYPGEAVKTNIWGTLTVLEAARRHGVERFVNVSTDKAANPASVLGHSKRIAEGLTAAVAERAEGTFLSVRFGNVLGSRGSVLEAFSAQVARGGPVTVTDPRVTRYFMTVHEAVQLVIQAAAIGAAGEALVLDMGEPVSIDAVARQLIAQSGRDVPVVYTGLRAGEKLHEELWGDGERDVRGAHPLVSHTWVPVFPPAAARELDPWAGADEVRAALAGATARLTVRLRTAAVTRPEPAAVPRPRGPEGLVVS